MRLRRGRRPRHLRPARGRPTRRALLATSVLASSLAVVVIGGGPARTEVPGTTTDASLPTDTDEPSSFQTDLSADGQVVAFTEINEELDRRRVYVYDVPSGVHELVSVEEGLSLVPGFPGLASAIDGSQPSISGDGNRVAFTHQPGGNPSIVMLRDRADGTTTTVYEDEALSTSLPAKRAASQPAISDDGLHVAYVADAIEGPFGHPTCSDGIDNDGDGLTDAEDPDCKPPDPAVPVPTSLGDHAQVYVRDAEASTPPILVSHVPGQPDVPGERRALAPAISGDGSRIVFLSDADLDDDPATVLDPGATNVWLWERATGEVRLVSRTLTGAAATTCFAVDISADGRYATFSCVDDDLVADDGHVGLDVFVADLDTGAIELVSVTSTGLPADGDSGHGAALSADGRYVVFGSEAANLLDAPGDDEPDPVAEVRIYVRDRIGGRTTHLSVDDAGDEVAGRGHMLPSISATGRYVAWTTYGAVDGCGRRLCGSQAYHRDRLPMLVVTPPAIDFGTALTEATPAPPRTITVRNAGFGPLEVTDLILAGPHASRFALPTGACTAPLHHDDTCTLQVAFTGGPAGSYHAEVQVSSTAPGGPGVVTLAAEVLPPEPPEPMECPADPSKCPPEPLECPADPSKCPPEPLECPADPSKCPPEPLECPADPSKCPPEPLECPADPSKCPPEPPDPCLVDPASCLPEPPTLEISPAVVRLGRVTTAIGEGWEPLSLVTLTPDLSDPAAGPAETVVVRADAEGRFRQPITIRHRVEELGPRLAVAWGESGEWTLDDYLVALPSVGPSTSFVVRFRGGSMALVPLFASIGTGPTNRTR